MYYNVGALGGAVGWGTALQTKVRGSDSRKCLWNFSLKWFFQLHYGPGVGSAVKKKWVESSWNVMAHGDAREEKWRGTWRNEWLAFNLHTTSEHDVSIITTVDAHTSAASSLLNWRPCRFKCTRPFRRKMKSGFCACAITFQTQSTRNISWG
jgi:hypothetical protein